MEENNWNLGHGLIEKVLLFDDHRSSDKKRAISTTTLIGDNWKAQRDLLKDIPLKENVDPMMRRSSTIGTGFHMRAEQALKLDPMVDAMERYMEKEIDDVYISGSFDLIYNKKICDWKTSYGKSFSKEKITKATIQMSIYRWLNQDMVIDDDAYVLFISASNNAYDSYKVMLMSLEETERYIKERLIYIKAQDVIDCKKKPYNSCNYCNYDEADCKELYKNNAGGF